MVKLIKESSWDTDFLHEVIWKLQDIFSDFGIESDYFNFSLDSTDDFGKFEMRLYVNDRQLELCKWEIIYYGDEGRFSEVEVHVNVSKEARKFYVPKGYFMETFRESFDEIYQFARNEAAKMIDGYTDWYGVDYPIEDEEFDEEFDESIKRNKRRMKEGLPVYLKGDNDNKSRFLSRFISDVKYWISLGKTPAADKFLWAGTPEEQAQVIQDTFDAITDQADRVLTQDDIDYYVGELLNRYNESVRRGSRKSLRENPSESIRGYWGYFPNERLDSWINDTEYEDRWYNNKNIRGYKLFPIPEDFEDSGDPKYDEVFGVYSTNDNKLFYGTKEEAYKELVYYLNNSLYEYRNDL